MDEAEAWFRKAIDIDPDKTIGIARLARLRGKALADGDLAYLERRIADPKLAETGRVGMLFAFANVLDARGRFGDAAK